MTFSEWDKSFNGQIEGIERDCFKTPWTLNMLDSVVGANNFYGVVATEGDKVVGYIGSIFNNWDVDILNVAVDKDFRRRKIGESLLTKLLAHYMKSGAEKIFLEVRKSNLIAQNLYKKFGFQQIAVRKKYYENTEDAIIMQKLLKV
ncbi:MAG: ribosomal protein S18-alanine N-acetyltransferase [Christensenellaceae bacterium]